MRGVEKWRPDRISAPEAREIWRRRQEELSGKSGRERRVITWPTQAREPAELPGWSSALQGPLSPWLHWSWGQRREAREIRRGRQEGPSRTGGAEEERRVFALPTGA